MTSKIKNGIKRIFGSHEENEYSPPAVTNSDGRKVLLITNELSRTGAPQMLRQLAEVMLENGDCVSVMAPEEGPLKDDFLKLGISLIITPKMKNPFADIAGDYELIVVNTLACANALKAVMKSGRPVIWWVHEGKTALHYYKSRLPKELPPNVKVLCASEYSQRLLPQYETGILRCCVDDLGTKEFAPSDKVMFLTVGSIEKRKGQDVLLKAIELIPEEYRAKARFLIIGSPLDGKLKEAIKSSEYAEYLEAVPRDDLLNLYGLALCTVIPSRDEPTSLIGIESAMSGRAFITSNMTGISEVVTDGANGLVFESGNAADLADKMKYAIDNPDKMQRMGLEARKLYEKYYTREAFDEAWSVCGSL